MTQDISTVPEDQSMAQKVDLQVLKAQLRPLRVAEVAEQVELWLELLENKCIAVEKALIAERRAETDEEIEKFSARDFESAHRAGRSHQARRSGRRLLRGQGGRRSQGHRVPRLPGQRGGDSAPLRAARRPGPGSSPGCGTPREGSRSARTSSSSSSRSSPFRILAGILSRLVGKALTAMRRTPELLRDFFVNTVRKVTMVIGLIVALSNVGFSMAPLIAAIGGAAFVIGFALQGTLSNFASGIMLLMYRPYNVGDVVEFGGGTMGTVAGQNLVSTTVKTFDNKIVMIPNNNIWGDVITNATASDKRRVDMVFGIGYSDDIAKSEEVLKKIVGEHSKVLSNPEPIIQVHELGDSSVNFVVRPWVKTADYWNVYWDITRAVKERFDAEGISIPFPQRDVHVYQEPLADSEDVVLLPRPAAPAPVEREPVITGDLGIEEGDAEAAEAEESAN